METSELRGPALMRAVADAIEAHPEQYDQGWWATVTDCGTAYCVGGWACTLVYGPSILPSGAGAEAMVLLELPEDETDLLFHSQWRPAEGLTVPEALRAISEGRSVESVTGEHYCRECESFSCDGSWLCLSSDDEL